MKRIKKYLSQILVMTMMSSVIGAMPITARAETNAKLSYTLYENTFDNGHKSLVSTSAEGYAFENEFLIYDGVNKYLEDFETVKYIPDGTTQENTAIRAGSADYCASQTFLFDFTKGGTKAGIRSGVVRVSFDFAFDMNSTADASRIGINIPKDGTNTSDGIRLMYFGRLTNEDNTTRGYAYQITDKFGGWPGGEKITEANTEAQHHFEVSLDFDNNLITYFVDGVALKEGETVKTQDITGAIMNNFMFAIGGIFKYVDNLKVVHEFTQPLECVIDSEFSETNPGNVFFDRETAKVNLNVINRDKDNAYSDVPVTITVKNGAGEIVETYTVKVTVGALGETNLEVPLKLSKYGAYTLLVTSEKSMETTARASRSVKAPENNPKTGVHMQVNGGKDKNIERVFHFIENAGLGNVRTDLGWDITENEDGTYSHSVSGESYIDRAVVESQKTGVEILGLLSESAMNDKYPGNDDGGFNNTEAYLNGYYDYAYTIANKYGDTIKAWEVCNEVNYVSRYKKDENGEFLYDKEGNHITEHDLGENYAPILLKAYEGIKVAKPDNTVISTGSSVFMDNEGNNMPQFAHGWLSVAENDTANTYFDEFGVHSYHPGMPPEVRDCWVRNADYPSGTDWKTREDYLKNNILKSHGFGDVKTWVTETGYYVGTIYGDVRTEEIAAAYNTRLLLQNEIYGYHDKFFIYNLINEGFDLKDPEHNYGMLCHWTNEEWETRSAYAAKPQYLAMAQWNKMMNGAEFLNVDRVYVPGIFKENEILVTPYDRYDAEFKKGDDIIHVVWDVYDNSEPVTVENTENKKYTIVYDMYGNAVDKLSYSDSYTYDAGKVPVYVLFTDEPEDDSEPEVMFYRDYEDYTGGNNANTEKSLDEPFNKKGNYGTFKMSGDGSFLNTTEEVSTFDGKGVKFDIFTSWNNGYSQLTDGGGSLTDIYDGTLYISYDEISDGTNREDVYFTSGGADYALSWYPGVRWSPINRNWGSDCTKTEAMLGAGKNHKVEIIIDPDTGEVKRYVNGTYLNTVTIKKTGLKELIFRWADGNIIDNLTVVYYPEDVKPQTFSMHPGTVDAENNTISVCLKSNAVDSNGANGNEISAPYGISPKTINETLFTVDGYNVSAVTKGDRSGEYIIKLAEGVTSDGVYTVTYNKDVRDLLGACIDENDKTVTLAPAMYKVSDVSITDNTATATYTNTEAVNKSFVLMIASYKEDGTLFEVNFTEVTAKSGSYNKNVSVKLNEEITGKTVKSFVIDDFSTLTPIYK